MKYPKGYHRDGLAQVAIRFPKPLFEAIIKMAEREKKNFNDMVIELVKVGKFDLEESDQHEEENA